jgi:hypothetical protein
LKAFYSIKKKKHCKGATTRFKRISGTNIVSFYLHNLTYLCMGLSLRMHPASFFLAVLFFLSGLSAAHAQLEKVDTTGFTPTQMETFHALRRSDATRSRGVRLTRNRIRPIGTERGADIHLKRIVLVPAMAVPSLNNGSDGGTRTVGSSSYTFSLIIGAGANFRWERLGYDGHEVIKKKPIGIQPMMMLYHRSSSGMEGVYAVTVNFLAYATLGYGYSTNSRLTNDNRHLILAGLSFSFEDILR